MVLCQPVLCFCWPAVSYRIRSCDLPQSTVSLEYQSGMSRVDVAIGIVLRGVEVLICRRKQGTHLAGLWEFPGGKIEPGETPEQAVRRELLEEVGLTVRVLRQLTPIEYDYLAVHIRLHPFLCEVLDGTARALAADEVRWVPIVKLRDYPMPAANAGLITCLQSELRPE